MVKQLLSNRWVQLILALLIGVIVGALFYPTKTIEERVKRETALEYESRINSLKESYESKQKVIQDNLKKEQESFRSYKSETSSKIAKLTEENRRLTESSKRQRFKLVKPDGTIIEKEYEENNREEVTSIVTEIRQEFKEKIEETEQKWKKAYKERLVSIKEKLDKREALLKEEHRKEIEKLEKERIVKVNEKKFRVAAGYTTDKDVRVQGGYTLWGPFSIESGIDYREGEVEGFLGVGFGF